MTYKLGYSKEPEKWEQFAACLNHPDPDIFHPSGKESDIEPALAVCRRCPVVTECGATAAEHQLVGIWGGQWRKGF